MELIVGIDLGTTNSEIALIRNGIPEVIPMEDGDPILPSVVGFDQQGNLLVGKAARNQLLIAPERTVKSIKRKMGEETTVKLGDKSFSPQEISAMILRTLKQRAEKAIGQEVKKAVITVPAFFNDSQRQATRDAGELAGLEVVRIINEPTAAVLTYDSNPPEMERILVYDLGGGTFDVSIAQVEGGVVEILSSHGDTKLGGDDFDQLLADHVCDQFQEKNGFDLRKNAISKSRVLRAVEDAKKQLSSQISVRIEEEFIADKDGAPLNLIAEVRRETYEKLIDPLLNKTLVCVDQSLTDSKLQAHQITKVLLVGGATRTPAIQRILSHRMGRPVGTEIEPDLAVAMGAAVQGGLISGADVGAVLIDIATHSLGIECVGIVNGVQSFNCFSPIIFRNTPLPASQTELYGTYVDYQTAVQVRVQQGENEDSRFNDMVGKFTIEGLAEVPRGNEISVNLNLNLDGILKVTATERATGLEKQIIIDNAAERFKTRQRANALARLDAIFTQQQQRDDAQAEGDISGLDDDQTAFEIAIPDDAPDDVRENLLKVGELMENAGKLMRSGKVDKNDMADISEKLGKLQRALGSRQYSEVNETIEELSDLIYYIEGGKS